MTALDRRDPSLHSWIILMHGRDESGPLFLPVKEAEAYALSRYCGTSQYANQGQRVIAGQWLTQPTAKPSPSPQANHRRT
jgi:uncharacterized protein DUF2252